MERSLARITGWLSLFLLLPWLLAKSAVAAGPDFSCEIMPLALPAAPIEAVAEGQEWEQFPLGPRAGHVGWLSWDGDYSLEALVQALTPPGTAERYRDPQNPSHTTFEPDAWLGGMPGVRNARSVHQAMAGLIGQRIRVPVYDSTRGSGGGLDYRLRHFVWVVPQAYSLAGRAWLSFRYEGEAPCRKNQPPEIISTPLQSAITGEVYHYLIEATDPDFDLGDIISYSLQQGLEGIQVAGESGDLSWLIEEAWRGTNRWPNDYCLASGGNDAQSAADVVMVVDESGSMGGEHAWLNDLALPLEAHLKSNGIGEDGLTNRYGLLGYERSPRPIMLDGAMMDDWEALRRAADSLKLYGGLEDGWRAIRYAFSSYPLRSNAAKNIILITDEGRDIADSSITYDALLSDLKSSGTILNAVVNARFVCRNGQGNQVAALGMDAEGTGYLADGEGGYITCRDARATWGHKNTTNTLDVYVDLALDAGGAAWDLNYLRAGGQLAQSFTAALIDIKVREIRQQLPPQPLPDLYISSIMEREGAIEVVVGNRGLVDVKEPMQISLYSGEAEAFASQSLAGLAQGEHQTLSFTLPEDIPAGLSAEITGEGTQECTSENNRLRVPWITVRAEDWNGLYDEQRFTLDILTPNRPPEITSTPDSTSSAGAVYTYAVTAQDPDLGDALQYSLLTAPPGMDIDPVSGLIHFKPNTGQLGRHVVDVRVEDLKGATAEQTYTLLVDEGYRLPRIVSTPYVRAVQGLEYRYALEVEHDAQAQLSFALVYGPEGMAVDEQGVVSWTVPGDFAGKTAEVVFRVEDQYGNYDLQFATLTGAASNSAPQITSEPGTWVVLGQTYSYAITAVDPDGDPLEYALLDGPPGMGLDQSSGALNWQPQESLSSPVTVVIQVRDPYRATAEQTFDITVYDEPNQPPQFDSEPLLQAWVGQPYQYQVVLSDANDDPLEVTLKSAPDGAAWDAETLSLSWTPTVEQLGEQQFVIEAVDPRDGTATQSFIVVVAMPNHPPAFESIPETTVTLGESYLYTAVAVDPDGDTVSYNLLEGPSGVLLNGVTGELTWTPTEGGEYAFVLQAQDERGGSVQQQFSVTVEVPPSLCHAPYAGN